MSNQWNTIIGYSTKITSYFTSLLQETTDYQAFADVIAHTTLIAKWACGAQSSSDITKCPKINRWTVGQPEDSKDVGFKECLSLTSTPGGMDDLKLAFLDEETLIRGSLLGAYPVFSGNLHKLGRYSLTPTCQPVNQSPPLLTTNVSNHWHTDTHK